MNNAKTKIVFPELSYQIIGAAFDVYNQLGWGCSERQYQHALASELKSRGINYRREVYVPFKYKAVNIGKYFADFVVGGKILLELKVVARPGYVHAKQILGYLQSGGHKLGILLYFSREGVKYRRIVNPAVSA